MIFLSLRVTADAEGGLKGPAQLRRSLRGRGGGSHQQAGLGIYRGIACKVASRKSSMSVFCKRFNQSMFSSVQQLQNRQAPFHRS